MYPGHTDMPALDFRHDSLTQKDHCYLRLRVRARTSVQDTAAAPGSMRFTTNEFYTHGGVYNYRTRDLPLRHGVWNEIDIYQLTPEVRLREDVMRVYFRNVGADTVYLDDLRIDIYEQRPR
jgi:hypothetical protein